MNNSQLSIKASQPIWKWPVNLFSYDKSPELTNLENSVLASLIARYEVGIHFCNSQIRKVLQRLIIPILDVVNIVEKKIKYNKTVSLIMREMHSRQKSFWAFTNKDWVEILSVKKSHNKSMGRCTAGAVGVAYLLCGEKNIPIQIDYPKRGLLARRIFGDALVNYSIQKVTNMLSTWGYTDTYLENKRCAVSDLILSNGSPYLEDLTYEKIIEIKNIHKHYFTYKEFYSISRVLYHLGLISEPIKHPANRGGKFIEATLKGIADEWVKISYDWFATSTISESTRKSVLNDLWKTGRWLGKKHPEITHPKQWDRKIVIEFITDAHKWVIGDYVNTNQGFAKYVGKPLAPASIQTFVGNIRKFFDDLQQWGWIENRFHPRSYLKLARETRSQVRVNPRVIDENFWLKMLQAACQLTESNLPKALFQYYLHPVELVRAVALTWLYAGLRNDEIRRLQVGCIKWEQVEVQDIQHKKDGTKTICLLTVPVHKSGGSFTKPVEPILGEAIELWEKIRPEQPKIRDRKTRSFVDCLFSYRGLPIGSTYINNTLIRILCQQAGIPESDTRGKITSHRARATILTKLSEVLDPYELAEWAGHKFINTTRHYVKRSLSQLSKAYEKVNLGRIEALIDHDVITSGVAVTGTPYIFYDLGHGLCSNIEFAICKHRMACARCMYYIPKGSAQAELIESKATVERWVKMIDLTQDEIDAVQGDQEAREKLIKLLEDVPTPEGLTPKELVQIQRRRMRECS